jgi:hypothetical protein
MTLKGKVTLKGGDPSEVLQAMTNSLLKQIDAKPDSKRLCLAGKPEETTQQTYRIGGKENDRVGNVFVWIMPPKDNPWKIDPRLVEEAKAHPVTIGQPHCAYLPHVAVAFPSYPDPDDRRLLLPTGQKFFVTNNAQMSHNTKLDGLGINAGFNQTMLSGETKEMALAPDPKNVVMLECAIHPWMSAYVWVFDHPFATVTKSDTAPEDLRVKRDDPTFGTYEIKYIPLGLKVRLFAWHEHNKYLLGERGKEIETREGEMTQDFELEVKP